METLFNLLAIVFIVLSALALYVLVGLGAFSRNPEKRQDAQLVLKKFRQDLRAIWKGTKTLDDVLKDKYWNDDNSKGS